MKHIASVMLVIIGITACTHLQTIGFYAGAILDGERSTTVENASPHSPHQLISFVAESTTVRLFVIGDWGNGSQLQRDVARVMTALARAEHPHAIISTGDNFYPRGVESPNDPMFEKRWKMVYPDSVLQIPWVIALGNHDHRGSIGAMIEYSTIEPRWVLPAPYYMTTISAGSTTVALFVLDTDSLLSDRANRRRQLRWLDSMLARANATMSLVVCHHPLRSYGLYGDTRILVEQLKPILDRHGVSAYLCGHEHDLQMIAHPDDSFTCIVSGSGGNARRTRCGKYSRFAWTGGGFVYLACRSDGSIVAQFISRTGKVLYSDTISVHRQGLEPRTR
ncbi:MAG: metallophosphoesterase [Chlorobi bacterium]|nr:metallophosphoesterase [Chlorobiota bacterium]